MDRNNDIDRIRRIFTRPGCERKIEMSWETDLQPMFDDDNQPKFLTISGESMEVVAERLSDNQDFNDATGIAFELSVRPDYCCKVYYVALLAQELTNLSSNPNIIWGFTHDANQIENVVLNTIYKLGITET